MKQECDGEREGEGRGRCAQTGSREGRVMRGEGCIPLDCTAPGGLKVNPSEAG